MTLDKLIVFLIAMALMYLLFIALPNRAKRKYESLAQREIIDVYEDLKAGVDEYVFFGRGHPYVWTEFSRETAEDIVLRSCEIISFPGSPFNFYDESQSHLYARSDLKHIYVVDRGETDSSTDLLHYQEWLDSQKQVGENIARYKGSS